MTETGDREALANLLQAKFKFVKQINDLIALVRLAEDELDHENSDADNHGGQLKEELEKLTELKELYEISVSHVTRHNHQEAERSIKTLEDHKKAYLSLKRDVDILVRKLSGELDDHESDNIEKQSEEDSEKQEGSTNRQTPTTEEDKSNDSEHVGDKDIDSDDSGDIDDVEADGDNEQSSFYYCKAISQCLFIVVVFYSILGIVLSFGLNSNQEKLDSDITTRPKLLGTNNNTCGENSFQLRDSVCDDTSNTAECLFDGGDCCLEFKATHLCKNCTCILQIDPEEMLDKFTQLEIKPLKISTGPETEIGMRWTVQVENVLNGTVCAKLCLEHENATNINSWHYQKHDHACKCGWMESALCLQELVTHDWSLDKNTIQDSTNAFVQLGKTISCSCIAIGFLINAERSRDAQEDYTDALAQTSSLWHCKQLCDQYSDCTWFSWKRVVPDLNGELVVSCHHIAGGKCFECLMMKEVSAGSMAASLEVSPEWISSSTDCDRVQTQFSTYSNSESNIHFVCPRNNAPIAEEQDNYFISLNGWTGSSVEVFKANGDTLVECAHSLMAPQNGLQGASGGIMIQDERNEIKLIIVCGGKVVFIESFGVKVDNSECFQLNSDGLSSRTNIGIKVSAPQVGSLRFEGRGSGASLVLGHGKSRLWITGGASLQDGSVYTTEFVHFANEINVDHGGYLMNEQGPDLPSTGLDNHCLAKIVPEAAILIGGQLKIHGEDSRVIGSAFSINVTTMVWKQQASLEIPRYGIACGTITYTDQTMVVIAAGGIAEIDPWTSNVEMLLVEEDGAVLGYRWFTGPSMPMPISDAAVATTLNQWALYVFGGRTNQGALDGMPFVFKLQCSISMQCVWSKLDQEMSAPNAKGVALSLPSSPLVSRGYLNSTTCNLDTLENGKSLFLLTTGFSSTYNHLSDTSAFVLTLESKHQPLSRCFSHDLGSPVPLVGAFGGVLGPSSDNNNTYYTPLICGGVGNEAANGYCYKLGEHPLGQYSNVNSSMMLSREGSASAVIHNGTTLWVTGGFDSSGLATATTEELVSNPNHGGSFTTEAGIQLPRPLAYHCLSMVDNRRAILHGGFNDTALDSYPIQLTWALTFPANGTHNASMDQMKWHLLSPILFARAHRICGVIRLDIGSKSDRRKVVVSAGGETRQEGKPLESDREETSLTNRTQFFKVNDVNNNVLDGVWEEGPRLPIKLSRAGSATTPDQAMLFVAGGLTEESPNSRIGSKAVFYLVCAQAHCVWTKDTMELMYSMISPVAMIIPAKQHFDTVDYATLLELESTDGTTCVWEGDGKCNGLNNNLDCAYDGGDCCLPRGEIDCTSCNKEACICHATLQSYCHNVEETCPDWANTNEISDGVCDDYLNMINCAYDGGDCCLDHVFTVYCDYCLCHTDVPNCVVGNIADGLCNARNNVAECFYDGGDCCNPIFEFCFFCSMEECSCKENGQLHCSLVSETCPDNLNHYHIGDGHCDENLSNFECGFDRDDCCYNSVFGNMGDCMHSYLVYRSWFT